MMKNLMRINKYIAQSTGCSRRKAEALVLAGHVKVNGSTIYNLGTKVSYGHDDVMVHNKLVNPRSFVYYAVNKPVGYTSTRLDPFAEKKVVDLAPKHPSVYPAGRLDKNSEGLILLTNDGELTQKLSHPSKHIEKEYYVEARTAKESWDSTQLRRLKSGVNIGGYKTKPADVAGWKHMGRRVSFYITLEEGKKRQIRRMAQKIGLEVELLRRVRIGKLKLGDIELGKYRKITPDDILEK